MSIHPKVNGAYKAMTDCNVKVAGAWKQAEIILTKVNGVWKEAWRKSTVIVVKTNNSFTIAIKGYDGTLVRKVQIKSLKLRLYDKSSGNLLAEKDYGTVEFTSDALPNLTVSNAGISRSAAFMPHITESKLTVYPTLEPSASYVYAEFEYAEVVKV